MRRLVRVSILVVVVVTGSLAAAGCSQVDPPALSMSTNASTDPYFTITRDDLITEVQEAQSQSSLAATKTSLGTDVIASYLTTQVLKEFQERFLAEQQVVVTDADQKAAQQAAQSSQTGAATDPQQIADQARLLAVERKLTEDAFNSGKLDREKFFRDFYDKNKASFSTPAQTCIHLIGIQAGTGNAAPTEADYTAAAAKAADIRKRLDTESFDAVASVSEVPNAPAGGDVGCVTADQLGPDLTATIAPLPNGTITQPLRTDGGYFIIRIDDRKPEATTSFEDAKADIAAGVAQELGRQLISDAALKDLERTVVTVDPRFGYWSYEQRAVLPPQPAQNPTVPPAPTSTELGQLPIGGGPSTTAATGSGASTTTRATASSTTTTTEGGSTASSTTTTAAAGAGAASTTTTAGAGGAASSTTTTTAPATSTTTTTRP